ncbi:hypothetical protein [Streptomyces sp. NPDC001380]|uniref:hypothetical protein n=1 Tax=Streptomyces sp. NPDC001380 TaxID=3364566 RepID=UPI00368924F6
MPRPRLLAAAALAAALAALTSCKPGTTGTDASSAAPAPAATAPGAASTPEASRSAGAPAADPAASDPATADPAAGGSSSAPADLPLDPEPSADCEAPKLPAGHRMVQVVGAPAAGVLRARTARFACDPNGGGFAGAGPAASYRLAPGAAVDLAVGATGRRRVTLSALERHVGDCLRHVRPAAPLSCSGDVYELALSPAGAVTAVREVWHP